MDCNGRWGDGLRQMRPDGRYRYGAGGRCIHGNEEGVIDAGNQFAQHGITQYERANNQQPQQVGQLQPLGKLGSSRWFGDRRSTPSLIA